MTIENTVILYFKQRTDNFEGDIKEYVCKVLVDIRKAKEKINEILESSDGDSAYEFLFATTNDIESKILFTDENVLF